MEALYIHIANKLDNVRKSAKTYASIREEILSWDLWRATFAEFLATFLFVFAGCASVNADPTNAVQIALCFGLAIMAMVQMVGHISGGHINPAVTIAMAVVFNITPVRALFYIIAQCVGAIVGAFFLKGISISGSPLGVTSLSGINAGQGFAVELFFTFILVAVIFATVDPNRTHFGNASIAIGLTVTLSHLAALHLTGSSINPARSLGSAAAANSWKDHWVYWVGPILGGCAAALLYKYFLNPYRNMPSMEETLQMVTSDKGLTFMESAGVKKIDVVSRNAENTESASL
ncbi:aquaporin-4-like [Argonauta hians]